MASHWNLIAQEIEGVASLQKCYLPPDLMQHVGAKVGTFVKIDHNMETVICSLWPKHDLASNTIFYNNAVKLKNKADSIYLHQKGPVSNNIQPIKVGRADSATVSIMIFDSETLQKFRNNTNCWHILKHQCLNLLNRICVSCLDASVVNLKDLECAKLYGISHIIVHEVLNSSGAEYKLDACIIRSSTTVHIRSIHSTEWHEQVSNRMPVRKPGGLDSVVTMLTDLVNFPAQQQMFEKLGIYPPKGILLRGPPGCGKTSLVRFVAAACNVFLIAINGPEVLGSMPGDTEANLRNLFNKAVMISSDGPCIIFIDEIDSVCAKKGKSSSLQDSRVTGQLVLLLDGLKSDQRVLVIAATNRPSALDPALRRPGRLDREVIVSPPTKDQRREILACHLHDIPTTFDFDIEAIATVTNGYVGADLVALCQEAAYIAIGERTGSNEINKISQSHLMAAVKKVRPSLHKGAQGIVDLTPVQWSDIGGLEQVKKNIQQAVEWPLRHPEAFRRMGISPPKGVLLYGPPGCCKTTLVRAAATACHATFLSLSGAQLYSPFVGDSERLITEVFQKARSAPPAIIFLDEIDSIVGKRSESSQSGVQDRILSTLLNEMDGVGVRLDDTAVTTAGNQMMVQREDVQNEEEPRTSTNTPTTCHSVLVVAATNRPDLLDEALVRPGRIDRIVHVPHPEEKERKEILNVFTRQMTLHECDLDLVAASTEFYTGADLENLCREAALSALTESLDSSVVTMDHFTKALLSVRPSLDEQLARQYSSINLDTFNTKKIS